MGKTKKNNKNRKNNKSGGATKKRNTFKNQHGGGVDEYDHDPLIIEINLQTGIQSYKFGHRWRTPPPRPPPRGLGECGRHP